MFRIFESNFWNVVAIIGATLVALFIILFIGGLIASIIPAIRRITRKIVDYFYLVLIPFPVIYLILYSASYNNGELSPDFFLSNEVAVTLKDLSIWFFTAGIFSATVKYLNTITYIKKKFKDIVLSSEFDEVLSRKLEILAYSKDYLKEHVNIEDLWRKVTLIKYETEFPSIYNKLKDIISNQFNEKNTSFYYKHFDMFFDLKLQKNNKDIEFEMSTNFTIVRPNIDGFEWTFSYEVLTESFEDENNNVLVYNLDSENQVSYKYKDREVIPKGEFSLIKLTYLLEGKEEYHIRNTRKFIQDIEKDRYYGFGSKRILDDLKINIEHCDKLKVFFTNVNGVKFIKEMKSKKNMQAHIHNGLITPGEKFKLFLIRKK